MARLVSASCPKCGAAVRVEPNAQYATCAYCRTQSLIQRGKTAPLPNGGPVIRVASPSTSVRWIVLASALLPALIGVVVAAIGVFGGLASMTTESDRTPNPIRIPGLGSDRTAAVGVSLVFGEKGEGPGQLGDARHVTTDPEGNIYVGDWDTGRLQKFDSQGHFSKMVEVPSDRNGNRHITGLAADYAGHVFATRGGDLLEYSSGTLELRKTVPGRFPKTIYGEVSCDGANNLYLLHTTASDNSLIKLNAGFQQVGRWDKIVSSVNRDDPGMDLHLAVRGSRVLVSSGFGNVVYAYDTQGKYTSRFGGKSVFTTTGAVAIDGKGRAYVVNFGSVSVFTPDGQHWKDLPRQTDWGAPRDVTVTMKDEALVVTLQGKVVRFEPLGSS